MKSKANTRIPPIPVTRSSMPPFEEYCAEIAGLWESHWLTNMGEKHKAFEAALQKYLEAPFVSLYVNGHLALENILAALGLPEGGEVITTPFTFASTTHAIVRNSLVPVFCDIDVKDCCIDATKIEALINEKTCAIVPVHVYGNICDVESIEILAKKYKLKVVYDAAHAFGVRYKGKSVAVFGDASMFSFHATKVFNSIEGGAVCFSDADLVQELNDRKNFGIRGPEACAYVGGNAKMNEFQAAMGLCNLRHLEEEIEKRARVCKAYRARLKDVKGIRLLEPQADVKSNYAYFPVFFENYKYNRDEVFELFAKENIFARKYFYPLTSDFACYKDLSTADGKRTPVARGVSETVLTLPLYGELTEANVDRVCRVMLR